MTARGVINTAIGAAVCRLIEQFEPPQLRLFDDPIVGSLLGPFVSLPLFFSAARWYALKRMDKITPGLYGAQVCRTRTIDDAVLSALAQGIDQLVILGAGLDSRAYRLPEIERVQVYELDLPEAQKRKKKRLKSALRRLPQNVRFVPIDFETRSLESTFAGTDFDPERPVVVVWEAVTQYLSEAAVVQIFKFFAKAAPGSRIVFTYVRKSVIEGRSEIPGARRLLDSVAENGAPWTFGLEPSSLKQYFEPYHLELVADVGAADYRDLYLRPIERSLTVSEVERMATAVVR
jgi:methyltransferase (TIGR00027 family)